MKKYLFSTLFLLGMALAVVAQNTGKRVWYNAYKDKDHKQYFTHYIMDRKAMEFHFDWDSDNEMVIKNYKKNGNTETFDAYYKDNPGKQFAHIVLTTDAANPANASITVQMVEYSSKKEFYYIVEDNTQLKNNSDGGSASVKGGGGAASVKDGAKNLLNKGKNLFKKKEQQPKQAKSSGSKDDEK